jgi:hypothetical protein
MHRRNTRTEKNYVFVYALHENNKGILHVYWLQVLLNDFGRPRSHSAPKFSFLLVDSMYIVGCNWNGKFQCKLILPCLMNLPQYRDVNLLISGIYSLSLCLEAGWKAWSV